MTEEWPARGSGRGLPAFALTCSHLLAAKWNRNMVLTRSPASSPPNTIMEFSYRLVESSSLSKALVKRWHQAEDALAQSTTDPRFSWQADTVTTLFRTVGFTVQLSEDVLHSRIYISPALLQRWFAPDSTPLSYRDQLAPHLSEKDVAMIQQVCERQLQGQTVQWRSPMIYLTARIAPNGVSP